MPQRGKSNEYQHNKVGVVEREKALDTNIFSYLQLWFYIRH